MKARIWVVAFALAIPVSTATPQEDANTEKYEQILNRVIFREVYSGIVRDGKRRMRIDPLPFTKRLPVGAPDFDNWDATGYEKDVVIASGDPTSRIVVDAGICAESENPCSFSFVYVFSVQKYFTSKPDEVAIRFLVTKNGERLTEGAIWGTEGHPFHYLREGAVWRRIETIPERERVNAAVKYMHAVHKADLRELANAGLIQLDR